MSAVSEGTLEIVYSLRYLQVALPAILESKNNDFSLLTEPERRCYYVCFDALLNTLLIEWDNTSMLDQDAQKRFRTQLLARIRTLFNEFNSVSGFFIFYQNKKMTNSKILVSRYLQHVRKSCDIYFGPLCCSDYRLCCYGQFECRDLRFRLYLRCGCRKYLCYV